MSIPKIIWQTYKCSFDELPDYAKEASKTWKDLNPEYEYRYLSDEDARVFVLKHYGEEWLSIFNSVPLGVMRGDILRYMLVHTYGGVYADLDTICVKPISSWMKDADLIVAPESSIEFCQWTFAAKPAHQVFKNLIDKMKNDFISPDYHSPHFVHRLTGPWAFTKAIFHTIQYASLNIAADSESINMCAGGIANKVYCYGGDKEKIFENDSVIHLFGSKVWQDGQYEQWTEDRLTKEYINTVDLRKMFLEQEIDYFHLLEDKK